LGSIWRPWVKEMVVPSLSPMLPAEISVIEWWQLDSPEIVLLRALWTVHEQLSATFSMMVVPSLF